MKFLTVRQFRGNTAGVRKELATEREIVLTANGRPFAMLTPVEPETVEEEALAIRQARARLAVERIRRHARRAGLDRMSMSDVDALIGKVRARRRGRNESCHRHQRPGLGIADQRRAMRSDNRSLSPGLFRCVPERSDPG